MRSVSEIICVDLVPETLAVAEQVGATYVINAAETDPVECVHELVGGVDYAFDVVGHPTVIEQVSAVLNQWERRFSSEYLPLVDSR